MPVGSDNAPVTEFEFSLEEQWAIHQAVLDYVEASVREDTVLPDPAVEITLLEKVEAGTFAFTAFEIERLRFTCDTHAARESTPDRDREPARSVVRKIDRQCPSATAR